MRVYLDNCCYNRPFASAEAASCDWFFTTDRGILKKVREVGGMRVANPVEFITWRKDND